MPVSSLQGGTMPQASNQFFPMMPSAMPQTGAPQSGAMPFQGTTLFGATGSESNPYGPMPSNAWGNGYSQPTSIFQPSTTPNPQGTTNSPVVTPEGHGFYTASSLDPALTQNLAYYLQSQIGQGTGANPLLSQLMQFFQTGQGGQNVPGASTLSTIANQGISALPEWQAMINAQQQNIGQNEANLREQFASMGGLAGSPFGTAMSNYASQTTADQNALLGQLQQQNILQGQLPAASSLFGGATQMGQFGQSLLPQYNPLNQEIYGLGTTFAPVLSKGSGAGATGGLLSGIGGLLGGISDLGTAASDAGGLAALFAL